MNIDDLRMAAEIGADEAEQQVHELEAEKEELRNRAMALEEALRNILVETNFISLGAARSYVREVLHNKG